MSQTIAAGSDHIVLLDEDGQVWSFGCGDAEDKLVSTLITNIPRIALPTAKRFGSTKSARNNGIPRIKTHKPLVQ